MWASGCGDISDILSTPCRTLLASDGCSHPYLYRLATAILIWIDLMPLDVGNSSAAFHITLHSML